MRRHGDSSRTLTYHLAAGVRSRHHSRRYAGFLALASRSKAGSIIQCSSARYLRVNTQTRSFYSTPKLLQVDPKDSSVEGENSVAVLGGGITGLATAYFLSQNFPNKHVTIFESKDVLGGWIRTDTVDVGDGNVLFESGCRSLRPKDAVGLLGLRLVQELDLMDDFLATDHFSPAARNRFIYYPDHLVKMPGPGTTTGDMVSMLWSEPVFSKLLHALWNDLGNETRSPDIEDESIGSFLARRGHTQIANNMVSAIFHGIYAGDIWRLSAKSILSGLWAKETRHGNLSQAFYEQYWHKRSWQFCDDLILQLQLQEGGYEWDRTLLEKGRNASVYTFRRGMGQLVERLEERLLERPNVTIKKFASIHAVGKAAQPPLMQIKYKDATTPQERDSMFSQVISTIRPDTLLDLLREFPAPSDVTQVSTTLADAIGSIPAATVCVVNLYFRTPNLLKTVSPPGGLPESLGKEGLCGFGYLLPASLPFEQNPERALGVIFDSDISPALHTTLPKESVGTRLTVMLGGHWWDDWTSYPDAAESEEMALQVLARHLGITEAPAAVRVSLQKECIPQYHVGHSQKMGAAHRELWDKFEGRLRVAGSWFTGVGVNDCLRSAWEVVQGIMRDERLLPQHRPKMTGLERFDGERPMALVKTRPMARDGKIYGSLEIMKLDDAPGGHGVLSKLIMQQLPEENKED